MKVRCLISRTHHIKYGRLERGLIMDIDTKYYDKNIFDVIVIYDSAEDIPIDTKNSRGLKIPPGKLANKRDRAFKEYQETLKQYEEENKLALERLNRRNR